MTINPPSGAFGPTNPYHIARAYGTQGVGPVQPVQRAVTTPVQPVEPVSRDSGAGPLRDANISRLVAGVVPGGVSFDSDGSARPAGSPLPFYRHPADKNAAATAVSIGRSLDVNG
ncbi:MAG: hypothetical protein KF869_15245 [Phycisphaeraceae bacterium]|nr:hypothetical protein [Phycisphaeraceae bacterium]